MKKGMFLVMLMLITPGAFANVLITEVLYDPATSEFDTEFVELYNQGEQDVDIGDWMLNTTSVQATIPSGTMIKANSYFLIADEDDSTAWPSNWPEPDYSGEEISLTNSNSGVQLLDSFGNLIDVVGWGSPSLNLYEGSPHSGASSGESLSRLTQNNTFVDTDNNLNDFFVTMPNPSNSNQGSESGFDISIQTEVSGNLPRVDNVNISPDDSQGDGVQILPVPAGNKAVVFSVIASDFDGYDDINEVIVKLDFGEVNLELKQQLNITSALYEGEMNMSYYMNPSNYSVTITAKDYSNLSSQYNISFEYLGVAAFDVDTDSIVYTSTSGAYSEVLGDLDLLTPIHPTIKNIGNLPLDFQIFGTNLDSGFETIGVENIEFTFLDNDYNSSLGGVLSAQPAPLLPSSP